MDEVRLDKAAFRALASETRVAILKQLGQRRKTLTELAGALGLAPSTLKEHMQPLLAAELVVLRDEGHKWKYYELTRKGRAVLNPGEAKVWVLLVASLVAFAFFSAQFQAPLTTEKAADIVLPRAEIAQSQAPPAPSSTVPLLLAGASASAALAAASAGMLIWRRAEQRA